MFEQIDRSWTLFLDRDGVINERIPGTYISDPAQLQLTAGCRQAIASFGFVFGKIVVVTNQAGIGKGIVTADQVEDIHKLIQEQLSLFRGRIDQFYYCPAKPEDKAPCRKPSTGMGLQAQKDFPEINFEKSIMVGDSLSDMQFGQALGMTCILIEGKKEEEALLADFPQAYRFKNLFEFAAALQADQSI